ncbi:MAG: sugar ABC transporter permease [Firmicutes bacterium]|nr:sugar ABC transporter permease [Bacillota bacterium]
MEAVDNLKTAGIQKKKRIFSKRNITLYLMILPVVVWYIIFAYVPMPGIAIAFADFKVSGFKGWVGFDNFKFIFNLKFFWQSFFNTWVFVIYNYIFGFPAPIILALLLNELRHKYFKKFIQTISTLPNFISWVVVSGMWITLLSPSTGYVNYIIKALGGEPVYFLSKASMFPALFTFIRIWKGIGYSSIIYLAAIAGIDPELYESASIDGATRLQQSWHITLPGIKYTVLVIFVLSFTGVLNLFEPIYVLKNPMIESTAEVLDTYIYSMGVVQARYPLATAMGLFKATISLALVLLSNFLSKKLTEDNRSIL